MNFEKKEIMELCSFHKAQTSYLPKLQKMSSQTESPWFHLLDNISITLEEGNGSLGLNNETDASRDVLLSNTFVQVGFYAVYFTIFVLGILGNVFVCWVVMRNKAMQTVTNFFITNLALSDILLCALAVPFTPLYTFLQKWIFGRLLCHLVPFAQGTSVYISTLTLTSIAIDRFFVIIYPFKPRMKVTTCLCIIAGIWIFSMLATSPYGIFIEFYPAEGDNSTSICGETWPSEETRQIFSACTALLQFALPVLIITFCYIRVSVKLSDRSRAKPGCKNVKKEAMERERKRRTNRMLIAMVAIFGLSWLPLNLINLLNDVFPHADSWKFYNLAFFFSHAIAMSSTCYNPFLYAWLNENFRKEFKQLLPCFFDQQPIPQARRRHSDRHNIADDGKTKVEAHDDVETLRFNVDSAKHPLAPAFHANQEAPAVYYKKADEGEIVELHLAPTSPPLTPPNTNNLENGRMNLSLSLSGLNETTSILI